MKFIKVVLFAFLFLVLDNSYAQSGIKKVSTDPIGQQAIIQLSNGNRVVADYATDTLYISDNATGDVVEVGFSDAVSSIEATPAHRQQLLNELRASLRDPEHLITIAPPRVATDTSLWTPPWEWCGDVVCISPFSDTDLSLSHETSALQGHQCGAPPHPDCVLPCDFGPCHPNPWPGGDGKLFYSGFGAGWEPDAGGGTVTMQELVAYDKDRFEAARQQACGAKVEYAATTAATGAVTVGSCMAWETVVGALGCGGGAILYLIGLHKTNQANKQCQAAYPGLGRW
ncbi:hypothetical protein [Luteimonas sp. A478]